MDEQSRPLLEEAEGTAAVPVHGVDAFVVTAWELHRGALYGFLLRSTRDEAAAEDLVQDAFLRLTGELRAGDRPLAPGRLPAVSERRRRFLRRSGKERWPERRVR